MATSHQTLKNIKKIMDRHGDEREIPFTTGGEWNGASIPVGYTFS
jgi:hypothetical protein